MNTSKLNRMSTFGIVAIALSVVMTMSGCMKPPKVEKNEEVAPNETAFVIPLEGETGSQAKFASVEFLETKKVATKRIVIPQREKKIGRFGHQIEWIPTVRVIKVDRRPVHREWTDEATTGTSSRQQKIHVESQDSIGFGVGATIEATILEEDTATYLYYFPAKGLEEVMDSNIRGYCQTMLSVGFGDYDLDECRLNKKTVFEEAFVAVRTFFKQKGITIDYFGSVEGLSYDNERIQTVIDDKFVKQQEIENAQKEQQAQAVRNDTMIAKKEAEAAATIKEAEQDQLAQEIRNQTKIAQAQADAQAAQKLLEAQEAKELETRLKVMLLEAEAKVAAANNLPSNILPSGSPLLMGLDAPQGEPRNSDK